MGATSPTVSCSCTLACTVPCTHGHPYSHSHHSVGASATSPAVACTCTLVYTMTRAHDHSYSPLHSLSPFRLQPHISHLRLRARHSCPHSFIHWCECHIASCHTHLHAGVCNGLHLRSLVFAFTLTITISIAVSWFSHVLGCTMLTLTPTLVHSLARVPRHQLLLALARCLTVLTCTCVHDTHAHNRSFTFVCSRSFMCVLSFVHLRSICHIITAT